MSKLLRKPEKNEIFQGVTIVQEVTAETSPLEYVGFKMIDLAPGAKFSESLGKQECCIVALTGKINVTDHEETFENLGTRDSVFEKIPTDSVYVSNDRRFEIEGVSQARVALCYSPSKKQLPTKLIKASDNGIEHRGILNNKRLVHNILPDSDPSANSLLVVEVYTESGNWSSYPPHKHDRDSLPDESFLEESYYHEMNPQQGFVFQRVYTDDRSLDETMTVENGDVVLVPAGYHPVGVPDGYTSYYLNVMAGPTRIWKFYNDPDHEWILKR
ncbi:5-deoxy-glucuronate isomerase [Bacillus canaveralius]|uniref:5-deoxy-glucuronate isomerase n=1 Tax=Bacillus canaveralius TaxID=1403243 RepID=A0A2N5GH09_9BACI|nr:MULTISPECIES: 5-deoxy-glucuronate isomerase [Bacillus]PLR80016.1 5-deoxy-glucuronate isomerase [Bacillus canaveralius]PLR83490.1 5-deoxy-glucuronate isomerase [Bacillus sp. V33-4]PLR99188.1 5-deoxy-glucuronate isomerase [Bacillus canaveralius]